MISPQTGNGGPVTTRNRRPTDKIIAAHQAPRPRHHSSASGVRLAARVLAIVDPIGARTRVVVGCPHCRSAHLHYLRDAEREAVKRAPCRGGRYLVIIEAAAVAA